jgi:hypothetical protein
VSDDFHLARRHLRVDAVRGPLADLALDLDYVLQTEGIGGRMRIRLQLGVEDDLDHAAAVAEVDEEHTAVVAAPRCPLTWSRCT